MVLRKDHISNFLFNFKHLKISFLNTVMVNKLLAHWKTTPKLDISLIDEYPLAQASKVPDAFQGSEPNWDKLRKQYGPNGVYVWHGIPELEWKEIILTFNSKDLDDAIINHTNILALKGYKIDSFTVQAQVKGVVTENTYSRTALYCFTQSPNKNNLIMGYRGPGSNFSGRMIASPAGHVKYKKGVEYGNIITDAVIHEGEEEMGLRKSEIQELTLVGAFREIEAPGNLFFYISHLNVPAEEIIERHTRAMQLYNGWKNEFRGNRIEKEIYAREKLEAVANTDKYFPVEAWENDRLFTIPNDPYEIIKMVPELTVVDSMPGSLALYFLHEFGEAHYARLMDAPGFKEKIDETELMGI